MSSHAQSGYLLGFFALVGRQKAADVAFRSAWNGKQCFNLRAGHLGLDAVGQIQDAMSVAKTDLQFDRVGERAEMVTKVEQVAHMRASECVDRLHVVAYCGDG